MNMHSRKHKIYIILGVLLSIIAFPVLFLISLNIFTYDLPGFDDSDLWSVHAEPLPEEENLYYALHELLPLLYYPQAKRQEIRAIVIEDEWDEQLVSVLLERNENLLLALDRIEIEGTYRDPRVLKNVHDTTDVNYIERFFVSDLAQINEINLIAARSYLRAGDHSLALTKAIRSVELGALLLESELTLIETMNARQIKSSGLDLLYELLPESTLAPDEYAEVQQVLENSKNSRAGLVSATQFEYVFLSKWIDGVARRDPDALEAIGWTSLQTGYTRSIFFPYRYLFQPNTTKNHRASLARQVIVDSHRKCSDEYTPIDIPRNVDSDKGELKQYLTPNSLGRVILSVSAGFPDLVPRHCELELQKIFIQTLFALRAYQDEHGMLPDSLEGLLPEFLPSVPADILTDQPLRYDREQKVLSSFLDSDRNMMQINF